MTKNLSSRFKFTVFSLADFTDPTLAETVLDILDAAPKEFKPERYGPHEPMQQVYQEASRSELIAHWLNEACARDDYRPRSGSLCLESLSRTKAQYFVAWEKDVAARFNLVAGSATLRGGNRPEDVRTFVEMATAIVTATDAPFALIDREVPQTNNLLTRIDLKVRLPDPCWMMFFGAPYVELFGKDRFRTAPCSRVEELPSGHFRLMITPSPHEPVPEEVKKRVREHFGLDAFSEPGKPIRSQRVGLVPSFDFRRVYSPES